MLASAIVARTISLASWQQLRTGGYPSGQRDLTVNQLAKCLQRFESFTAHKLRHLTSGVVSAQQALIAQTVEHVLGKNGVMGSNPIEGSDRTKTLSSIYIGERKNGKRGF